MSDDGGVVRVTINGSNEKSDQFQVDVVTLFSTFSQ